VAGLAASFGSGAMTNPISDIEKAEVILITGSNTTENHPVISSYIKRAATFKDAKLIVVDPRRIKLSHFAKQWLRPQPGTDVAWINGMMNVIINENLYDKDFVEKRCENFEGLKQSVALFTPEYVQGISGIPAADLIESARLYAGAKAASIIYCMGITQHVSGTDNVKSLANLAMLCGNMGIEGGGVNPLRGQNNVQGACDMGGLPNVYPAYQPINPDTTRKFEGAWGVTGMSDKPGLTVTEMIPKAHSGEIKAFYIVGENPLVSDADISHVEASFKQLDFLVVQDIFMTETARKADVVLPSLCFAEKDGTFSNTERKVQRVRKAVDGPGMAKADWEITMLLAQKMGSGMNYSDSREIFEEIRSVTPSYAGISYQRIEREGLHWPCPTADHPGTPVLHAGQFTRGKGLFHAIDFVPPAEKTDAEFPLTLTTGRELYHYHTGTMTRKSPGLNERSPECFVEMAKNDAEKFGIIAASMVTVASRRGEIKARVKISDQAVEGTVFIPFHYAESAANRLTNTALDPVAKIPEFKVCAVRVTPVSDHA
jgi:formate dehydrogenase alpha subunit